MLKTTGFKELGEKFARLSLEMQVKTARSATSAAANVVKKLAVLKAPIDAPEETPRVPPGNLKKSIRVARVSPSKTPMTSAHMVFVRSGKKAFFASRYGSIIEYGSVKQGPRPFMRPAGDEGKTRAVEAMRAKIIAGVNKTK